MGEWFRAVLFDFDGTLADSYQGIAASVNHVRNECGLAPMPVEEVRRFVGRGPAHLLSHTVPGCDIEHAVASYRNHHPKVMRAGTTLLPGARAILEVLHSAGLPLAICSNKPRVFTQEIIEFLGLTAVFAAILGPEDVSRPKPAPDMLLEGLKRLGVSAAEALYVGDMIVDIETARAAGVRVWVVPTGSDTRAALENARPDRLLQNLSELPGAVIHAS